ncbi:MAG: mechanosensitive ion channel family protein [Verrucomicrobiota bacterium]
MEYLDAWGEFLMPEGGFNPTDVWQILILLVLLFVSSRVPVKSLPTDLIERYSPRLWCKAHLSYLVFWAALTLVYVSIAGLGGVSLDVLRFFVCLGGAWILIGLVTSLLREKFWAESVAFVAYLLSGFFGLALAEESVRLLDQLRLTVGDFSVSAWEILAGILAFAFTLWISVAISRIIEGRVRKISRLTPSLKVLVSKVLRIIIVVIALIVAMSSMGVDLSALTVLGGAVGLGVGFGLQKVVSNFVSGIFLLLDNSIKPGDVIEIEGTYGWINNLRARYASVITRDGTEHLIPNEDLITERVINWSFTDNLVRQKVPIGVSYKEDPHRCIEIVLEATRSIDRVLSNPGPVCQLTGFGDSSLDLELRFWISDPARGVSNVKSDVLLKVWDAFKENNIEIPYPQRDLHIRTPETITVNKADPDPD